MGTFYACGAYQLSINPFNTSNVGRRGNSSYKSHDSAESLGTEFSDKIDRNDIQYQYQDRFHWEEEADDLSQRLLQKITEQNMRKVNSEGDISDIDQEVGKLRGKRYFPTALDPADGQQNDDQ